jgi:phage terminase small subunit
MSKPATRKPLNARQRRFIDAVVEGHDATAAALQAGYRMWAARQTGYDLLQRPDVQEAVARGKGRKASRLSRETALEELAAIAYSNILDYAQVDENQRLTLDLSRLDRAAAAGVRELTVVEYSDHKRSTYRRTLKIRMGNKPYALRLLLANLPPTENIPPPAGARPGNIPDPTQTRPENIPDLTAASAGEAENIGKSAGAGRNPGDFVCAALPARPLAGPAPSAEGVASTAP